MKQRRKRERLWRQRRCILSLLALPLCLLQNCRSYRSQKRVAVIGPTGGLVYWQVYDHAVAAGDRTIQFSYSSPQAINDSPEQAHMVSAAIERKVDGIIIVPAHQLVLVSVVREALRSDIPVVVVGAPIALPKNERLTMVTQDDAAIGRMAAERLLQLMHRAGRVGIVSSSPTLESSVTREQAFTNRIREERGMSIADVRYALSDWARARQGALDLTSQDSMKVGGIFSVDEFCTHGVISAFEGQPDSRPFLVGVGQESDQLDSLREHRIDALITTDPKELASESVQALRLLLARQVAFPQTVTVHLVDTANLNDASVRNMREAP